MISRTCPECASTWYSADTIGVWICPGCGAEIYPQEEAPENAGPEKPECRYTLRAGPARRLTLVRK